jgi:ATP-dependent Lhr-like helicase
LRAALLRAPPAPAARPTGPGDDDETDAEELLPAVLGEWLSFYGPQPVPAVAAALGLDEARLESAVDDLIESRRIVRGRLVEGGGDFDICDGENFEILLRLARSGAAPALEPLAISWLPVLLARCQGLSHPAGGTDALLERLEKLACLPRRARRWEAEILPARVQPYQTAWLDSAMQEGDLHWVGCGTGRVAMCFGEDLELLAREGETGADPGAEAEADDLADVFRDPAGRYDFAALRASSGLSPGELTGRLWEAAWRGRVTNDSFLVLRRGIETDFTVSPVDAPRRIGRRRGARRPGRRAFARRRASLPMAGSWFRLPRREGDDDLIEAEERNKDRARLLLGRYGVVFRELLRREAPGFRWADVFRSLRLMELSGEVLAGCFFHGPEGLQFASPSTCRLLTAGLGDDDVWWVNATDPASVCGLGLAGLRGELPPRVPGNHLVYRGPEIVVASRRMGGELTIHAEPDDARMPRYLAFLNHLLTRAFQPVRRVRVETINGTDAADSPYVGVMRGLFEVVGDYRSVILYRRRAT